MKTLSQMYVPLDKEVPDNILEIIRIRLDSGLHSLNALLCNVSVSVIFYLFFFCKKIHNKYVHCVQAKIKPKCLSYLLQNLDDSEKICGAVSWKIWHVVT